MGDQKEGVINIPQLFITERRPPQNKQTVLIYYSTIRLVYTTSVALLSLVSSILNIFFTTSELFKWLSFLLFVCFTHIFTSWIITPLLFLIERKFAKKGKKVMYFVFALQKNVIYFLWSVSFLMSWLVLMKPHKTNLFHHLITSTLATFVVVSGIWILKIVILKHLNCRFRPKDFFDKIQGLIYPEYLLQTLVSGGNATTLFTICDALHHASQLETTDFLVFQNLTDNELRDIQEKDLKRLMKKEDLTNFLILFEALETRIISQASFKNWMVTVCNDRESLVNLLNDTSAVIEDLDYILFVNLLLLVPLSWYILMGFATTKFLLFVSSSWLGVFIFGNTSKSISEGIIFVFVIHPFDIGDHCIIDNEQMIVKEIDIYKTVFLKENNHEMCYSHSALATKSIINLNRSSEVRDTLEVHVGTKTSEEKIAALKLKIDEFLESKPESWCAGYSLEIKGTDDTRLRYTLQVTHATSIQTYQAKNYQRSELVLELKRLSEELGIMYLSIQ